MINIEPTGDPLGATVTGIDLHEPLSKGDFAAVLRALGEHGVLRFPDQLITPAQLRELSARFGALQTLSMQALHEPGFPEVSILSNLIKDGKPIGVPDAGQAWHTDMTYNAGGKRGFINILVAHEVPMRDGRPLGATEFTNTHAAYDGLPEDIKQRLAGANAVHNHGMYWDAMIAKGSNRAPLTPELRAEKPPVRHPVFLTHPITGRKVIYVNPGYVESIDDLAPDESRRMIDTLFEHILKPEYRYVHRWKVKDLLMWDHLGTWHNAVADYGPHEHRLMKRCQVMADRIFDPAFVETALAG